MLHGSAVVSRGKDVVHEGVATLIRDQLASTSGYVCHITNGRQGNELDITFHGENLTCTRKRMTPPDIYASELME